MDPVREEDGALGRDDMLSHLLLSIGRGFLALVFFIGIKKIRGMVDGEILAGCLLFPRGHDMTCLKGRGIFSKRTYLL